ncbi:MFS transporter [Streptomyces halobius]|uniref:MFS transporter n=1 Tax=Streptomyces halobius TaxID=2879846 RepID=A0ABY4M6N4_9ACTN|nr:MFS transporter [Streptomyces halobius]UQA92489.1 MFS transporter [Streptomyces halobius]
MKILFGHRNGRLFIIGQGFSIIGTSLLLLTSGIWVKTLTGSNSAAGMTIFMVVLGALCAPVGGVLADRLNRKRLLICANLLTALVVLLLLTVSGEQDVWIIYAVMFCCGVSGGVIDTAQTALIVDLFPEPDLPNVNGAIQTVRQGIRLFAPILGASLFTSVGVGWIAVIDAVMLLGSTATLFALRVAVEPGSDGPKPRVSWFDELTAGVRHIAATPVLRQLVAASSLTVIAFGLMETLSFAVVSSGLHRPPTFLGVLLTMEGLGAVVGGLTAGWIMRRLNETVIVVLGLLSCALGAALLVASSLVPALIGMLLTGVATPWVFIGNLTVGQRVTPREIIGRVYSAFSTVLTVPQVLAISLGAALVAAVDYRIVLVTMAVVLVLAAGYLRSRPEQRLFASTPSVESTPTLDERGAGAASASDERAAVAAPTSDEREGTRS